MQSGVTDDGGMYISFSNNDEENYWGGRSGIPQNWNGGFHFSDKFDNNRQSLNSGYKFSKVNAPMTSSTFSRVFLPDSSWTTNSRTNSFNSTIRHAVNLTLDFNLDSNNSIKWTTKANKRKVNNTSDYYTESLTEDLDSINNSTRHRTNNTDANNLTSSILWKHKFKKLSRTLSVNADLNWGKTENEGLNQSLNRFYDNGVLFSQDTIDQLNIQNSENKGITTKFAYTEPLAKDFYLELSYSLAYNNNSNERIINEKNVGGKYEVIVDTLSNSFVFNRMVHTPGLNFRVNKKKYNYSLAPQLDLVTSNKRM